MDELSQDLFNLRDEQPLPSRGSLLVAKPSVDDACFRRSVIALVDHDNEEGTMGVILNRLTGYMLGDILPEVANADEVPLYLGGPVRPEMLFFVHTLGNEVIPQSVQIGRGLFFGGDYEAIKQYVASGRPTDGRLKFILGYSGWESGQLDSEIARHDWAVLKTYDTAMAMADTGEQMWQQAVRSFGDRYLMWLNWPRNATLN